MVSAGETPDQDISYRGIATLAEIWRQLPPGFEPDVVAWVETGRGAPPDDVGDARVPFIRWTADGAGLVERMIAELGEVRRVAAGAR